MDETDQVNICYESLETSFRLGYGFSSFECAKLGSLCPSLQVISDECVGLLDFSVSGPKFGT